MSRPKFVKIDDDNTQTNFDELTKKFAEFSSLVDSKEVEQTLVTGDNAVTVPMPRPRGRVITYQSAAANFFDKGLDSNGRWTINASAPCTVRLFFF